MVHCHYIYTFVCHKPFLSFLPGLPGQSRRQCVVGEVRGHHTQQTQLTVGVGVGISIFVRTSDIQIFQGADRTSGLSHPPRGQGHRPPWFPCAFPAQLGWRPSPLPSPLLPVSPGRPHPRVGPRPLLGNSPDGSLSCSVVLTDGPGGTWPLSGSRISLTSVRTQVLAAPLSNSSQWCDQMTSGWSPLTLQRSRLQMVSWTFLLH